VNYEAPISRHCKEYWRKGRKIRQRSSRLSPKADKSLER